MRCDRERLLKWTLAVCCAVMFLSLGPRALWDPDEGRYAEMAREVLALNDWVTPHLNYLLYFEKPMMFMWLEAISFKVLGVSEWAARLVSLLEALGGVFLVGLLAKRLWGIRAALIASLCLITSVEFFVLASAVDINMTLSFFITAAFVSFWLGHSEGRSGYFYLFWASMACATLTKGPIGVILPGGAIGIYILITRQFKLISTSKPVAGILLYLALTLPWFIIVSVRNPDFFTFFFINQNIQRYAMSKERYQPFYYFFLIILVGFLPWTFLLPTVVKETWAHRMSKEIIYIGLWFGFIFAFFTPSHSKLATYILPCFPPLALLTANAVHTAPAKVRMPLILTGIFWCLAGIVLVMSPFILTHGLMNLSGNGVEPFMHYGPLMGGILIIGVITGLLSGLKYDNAAGIGIIGVTIMITALIFSPLWDDMRSTRTLVKNMPTQTKLYTYKAYYPSSSFYTQGKVVLVDYSGELDFGVRHSISQGAVLTADELAVLMKKDKDAYCLSTMKNLPALRTRIPEMGIVRRTGNLCLLNIPR
jgi:4-amino-4-deoxy-L-arabinose transferase-like glycosyltransferase